MISIQKVNAAAIACNAAEVSQTFNFSGTNTWPSGTTSKSFNVGSGSNAVTLTFTNTQAVTPMSGDPQLQTLGNTANTLSVSSNGGYTGGTLLSTFALSTNRTINKLSYTIMDEDQFNGGGYLFRDRTVSSTNVGFTTAITAQVGANQTISAATGTATATNSAGCDDTDNSCNIYLEFNQTGISSASSQFIAAHTGTSTQQRIGFNTFAWCLPKTTLTLRKVWVNAKVNDAVTVTATGLTSLSAVANTTSETDTGIAQGVTPGSAITIGETFTTGSSSNYTSVLSCTGNATPLSGNVLTVNAADTAIVCTQTNTRKSATITLRKSWSNAIVNDAVTVTTAGGTVNPSFASVANTANETDTGTATAVFAGETLTFSEPFSVGSAANYNASLSCTGATDTNLADGLTINAADTNIVCTYTNSRRTANLTARKTWTNGKINDAVNITTTGGLNNVNFNATANTVSETDTATAITVYAGDALTFAESFTTGTATNYNRTLACTGNTTALAGSVLTVNSADTNITCTYTNSRIAQSIRVDKQWTNSVTGHTATVTTTGGTNNPTFSSTAPTNTTGTAVTVYAGDVVTLPAETFGGGASASDYNTNLACTGGSTLASGAVGRSITISNSTIATTCTYTNAKLPNITITKISNGGVGSFDFTGTNGFSNQAITTVSSGVGVAGATQRLTTAGVATQITETVPYGFALTNVSCTGLGTGTATVNYNTATVTLDANATAGPNNIACTFTNTAYGTTPTDPLLKTTRFSAVPDVPTIVRGFSGTQTIVMTNHGPDDATNVVVYYRPLLATGVSVTSVSSPAGACSFSSPDWVCPAIASVLNGASFNISVTYSTTNASSLGIAQQGEIRVNSNEYTECGGVNEYKYNVWGSGGNAQPQPAPTNSAFWVGNTNTTTTATPSGAYSTESTDIFQAWPLNQDSPTGSYLYSPVAGRANNIYSPSSTNAIPTVSKVITGLNGQPENNVLLPQFGSTSTFTGDNKRAWEGQTCVYMPVATTVTPCLTMFDDAGYISVQNVSTGVTTVAAGQSSWNPGSVLSGSVAVSPGYYIIKARISNRNTNGSNSEDAQGGYGQLAGIGSATCSTADLDALAQNAVPEKINIVEPVTVTLTKISQGGTGTFNFTGDSGFGTQSITTVTSGVGVTAASKTLSAVGVATTITETIPSGYVVSNISCSGLGAGGTATPNLVTGSVLLDSAATAAGANINCTFTNVGAAFTITGQVFLDNGKNAAIPHNGILEADELGIGNITVNLTDCASTIYQSTVTDGAGAYSLGIPNSIVAGSSLCVVEQPSSNLISVSGAAGSTGGSYSLAQDRTQFILSAATNYTGVNFGNVVQSQLTGTGNQTIAAGTTASYGHQFIAGTEGTVTFSTAQAPTPNLTWTSLVYLDNNCNALLDAGDTQVTTPILVVADQVLCLVQKVQSPSTASNGAQDVSTLSASFVYAAPSVIVGNYSQNDTTIIMDTGLVLVKKVRQVLSCPSTVADTNVFVTNNQALPNTLIEYQIVYSNPSSNVVSNIVINDMTPSFTTFRSASCRTTPPSVLCSVSSSPTVGGVGAIQWNIANNPLGLGSGQSGDVRFCVRVDQ
ncbi:MAG: hypothetical protein H6997_04330 [Moraxellaceae bacterium]|nr:hypothetical protein [Moraxellaceae bacterium]